MAKASVFKVETRPQTLKHGVFPEWSINPTNDSTMSLYLKQKGLLSLLLQVVLNRYPHSGIHYKVVIHAKIPVLSQ